MRAWIAVAVVAAAGAGCAGSAAHLPAGFDPARDTALVALRDSTRSCGTPQYPPSMSVTGVEGRVVISVFVDTAGHAHRDSVEVVAASDTAFVAPAVDFVVACRYTVPRIRGRPVAQWVTAPVEFRLQGAGRVTVPGRTVRPR
jgi:TonB family protein